jgi:hypothetical protein
MFFKRKKEQDSRKVGQPQVKKTEAPKVNKVEQCRLCGLPAISAGFCGSCANGLG